MARSKRAISAAILVGAIVVPGVINYVLVRNGLGTLGTVVWALGYGTGILALWYVWLRPLDLSGPGASEMRNAEDRATDSEAETDQPRSERETRG